MPFNLTVLHIAPLHNVLNSLRKGYKLTILVNAIPLTRCNHFLTNQPNYLLDYILFQLSLTSYKNYFAPNRVFCIYLAVLGLFQVTF